MSEPIPRPNYLTSEPRTTEPEDCEGAGGHDWKFLGEAEDGTEFYKCRRCGMPGEK